LKEKYPDHPKTKFPNKDCSWFSQKIWTEISRLSDLKNFEGLYKHFYDLETFNGFQRIYESLQPHSEELPPQLDKMKLNSLGKLCVLRTLRPDKIIPAIQIFVKEYLTEEFIFPPAFNLAEIYRDSSVTTPLIFVLSPGSDPFASLNVFAGQKGKDIKAISLG
jgi:dynein heavy chain